MECYVFSELARDPVVQGLLQMREQGMREGYFTAFRILLDFACTSAYSQSTVREYVLRQILDSPAAGRYIGQSGAAPYYKEDLKRISAALLEVDWDLFCRKHNLLPFPRGGMESKPKKTESYRLRVEHLLEAKTADELYADLVKFFGRYADSSEAKYTAFRWDGRELIGIETPDPLAFEQLGGLEYQKSALIDNTRAFLLGQPANDILLVGGSGTGKSSCVKATLNLYAAEGMRLVEVAKRDIATLPRLLQVLSRKKRYYIIFIDDLSFENPDEGYLELKVVLDGQVEKRPSNILIYATSNRRRLVRESWKDRDPDEDVHENDTLHEKLSLSERFGIRLYFPVLTQKEYFDIVRLLLERQGIHWTEDIGRQAATWATQYNGRSGRTAKQFVADYIGSL